MLYPLVGLLLGGALALLGWLFGASHPALAATLVLIAWVWGTGALHLDGLADCADAWVGGLGDRARTLAIMKDPRLGAMGAVALTLALLAKWAALWVLMAAAADGDPAPWVALVLTPALARLQILALALSTPGASETGMGAALRQALPPAPARVLVVLCWLLAWPWLGAAWLAWLAVAAAVLLSWRASVMQRLGGFTGDTAGALVEMTEVALLLSIAALRG